MEEKGEFEERPEVKPADQVPLPKAKANPTMGILCFVLALVTIGLGGFILYDKVISPAEETKCKTAPEVAQSENNFVDTNKKVKQILNEITDELYKFGGNGLYSLNKTYDTYVTYEFEDNYATNLEGAYGVSFNMNDYSYTTKLASSGVIEKVFTKYGLKKSSFNDPAYIGEGNVYYESEDGYVCEYSSTSAPTIVNCAHNSWLSEEKKTLVKGLIDAYRRDEEYYKDYSGILYIDASVDNVKKATNEKYEYLVASVPDAGALFYRNIEDGGWKYLASTQQAPDCDWFKTDEQKKGFAGFECYDYTTQDFSIVK